MAEFVSGMAVLLLDKLRSISYQKICLVWGLKVELKKLENSMSIVKDVVLDAEEKQAQDERISSWLTQLKDVFLDAEDVLDEFVCEKARRKSVTEHGSSRRKVRRFFSRSNPVYFSMKLAQTVKDLKERLDKLSVVCGDFNLTPRREERHKIATNGSRDFYSYIDASTVFGREVDKQNIINLLIDKADKSSHDQKIVSAISVVAIIGIAGLGKTTLARQVYNDKRVDKHFQLKMWVSVSKDFDIRRLIGEILDSAKGKKNENLTDDQRQTHLREHLEGRRFLLVLDNVWNEDRDKWVELKEFLKGGSEGSKIIVTTRSQQVANCMGPDSKTYELEGLTTEHSLCLFLKCAYVEGLPDKTRRQRLSAIGEEIVHEKCEGIPLSVITLGTLLYLNWNEQDWRRTKESEIWGLKAYKDKVFAALQLSYNDLSFNLKQCFLYCLLFPKRQEIYSLELIQLWVAHGVLPLDENKDRSLEDIGHECFKELWLRSFFQYVKNCGWYYSFSMHDVVHDFALFVAQNEFLSVKNSVTNVPERVRYLAINRESDDKDKALTNVPDRVRHLAINRQSDDKDEALANVSYRIQHLEINQQSDDKNEAPTCLDKLKASLQTISFPDLSLKPLITSIFDEYLIKNYKNLRMLDLSNSSFETLPSYIGRMKCLRSLNLSGNSELTILHDSISKLQSLQSLQLKGCSKLGKLPSNIKNLSTSLVFLSITTKEEFIPENGIQSLTSLRTLMIDGCDNLVHMSDRMSCLTALKTLVISSCKKLTLFNDKPDKCDKVGALSLQKLILVELPMAIALPRWLEGCKLSLQYLCLSCCPYFTELPEWLPNAMSLQKIEIMQCPNLCSLPEGMHRLNSVEKFTIFECPKLKEHVEAIYPEEWLEKICFEEILEQQAKIIRKEYSESGDAGRTENFLTEDENTEHTQKISELYSKGKLKHSGEAEKVWTEDENTKLIQTISELYSKGKLKVEDNFKPGHLEAIRRLLVPKLPGSDLTTKHIESQIKTLKTSFQIVHEILTGPNSSDFDWDSEKKMVIAKKAVWDAYIKIHAEAKPFRYKAFPSYEELMFRIFGKDGATKKGLETILADEVEESNESLGSKNSVEGEDHVEEDELNSVEGEDHDQDDDDDDDDLEYFSSFSETPEMFPTSSSSDGLSKKKRQSVGLGDIEEAIKEAAHVIAGEIKDSTNRISQEINEKFMTLNNELMKITTPTLTERQKTSH